MAMRAIGEQRGVKLDSEPLQKATIQLAIGCLSSPIPLLRAAAADTLGRLAQAVAVPKFVADMAQTAFSKIRDSRDVPNRCETTTSIPFRSGYALMLGCLHKYTGSLGSEQHLNTGVSVLLALAQEQSSPIVQVRNLSQRRLLVGLGNIGFGVSGRNRWRHVPQLRGPCLIPLHSPPPQHRQCQRRGRPLYWQTGETLSSHSCQRDHQHSFSCLR